MLVENGVIRTANYNDRLRCVGLIHSADCLMQEGVMQTHDEETWKFFKHSSVTCVLAPRYASSKLSIFKQQACFILCNRSCFK